MSWADGLVRMASEAADALDPTMRRTAQRGERNQVVIHFDMDTDGTLGPGQLDMGPVVPDAVARYLACDATIQVVTSRLGQIVGITPTVRTPNRALRRALARRDQGCTHPLCSQRLWLHAHHIRTFYRISGHRDGPELVQSADQVASSPAAAARSVRRPAAPASPSCRGSRRHATTTGGRGGDGVQLAAHRGPGRGGEQPRPPRLADAAMRGPADPGRPATTTNATARRALRSPVAGRRGAFVPISEQARPASIEAGTAPRATGFARVLRRCRLWLSFDGFQVVVDSDDDLPGQLLVAHPGVLRRVTQRRRYWNVFLGRWMPGIPCTLSGQLRALAPSDTTDD